MTKAAKRAIFAILGKSDVTDEELMTAFTETEPLINSPPLTSLQNLKTTYFDAQSLHLRTGRW